MGSKLITQIAIYKGDDLVKLENQVNDFLVDIEVEGGEVLTVQYSHGYGESENRGVAGVPPVIMVTYRDMKAAD